MEKQERNVKEPRAFNLFTLGNALDNIAKQEGVAYQTIRNWKKEFQWVKRKREIDEAVQKEQQEAITQFKKKEIRIVMNLMIKTMNDIQTSGKGNVRDFIMLSNKFKELTPLELVIY